MFGLVKLLSLPALLVGAALLAKVVDSCPYIANESRNQKRKQIKLPSNHPPMVGGATPETTSIEDDDDDDCVFLEDTAEPVYSTSTTHRILQNGGFFDAFMDIVMFLINLVLGLFQGDTDAPVTDLTSAISAARSDIQNILDDDRAAEFLRLAFHDCTGVNGICDGCLDLSNIDNGGLDDPIDDLEPIVEDYAEFLTRGDIWALAAYVAIEEQQTGGTTIPFDLQFVQRPSCDDPNNPPEDNLPSAHLTTGGLVTYFGDVFDLNGRETAAVMGAHTL